jgi:hypothetical protein
MNAPEFNAGLTNPEAKYKQISEKLAQLEQIDVNILDTTSQDTLTRTIALIESDLKNWSTVDDTWYNASMNEINDNIGSLVAETYIPYSLRNTVYAGITGMYGPGKYVYAISTKEDWLAFVADPNLSVSSDTHLHFTNDIDMQSIEMAPVCIDTEWCGRIDGHGHVLKNVNIVGAPTSDASSGVGLIGYYGGDSIQNLGIESGTIRCTGSATGCNVGAFVGCCGASFTLKNCWNGATIYRDSTSGTSSKVAGLVGRTTASATVTIDNCYILGDIVTDVSAQVISFMSAWDRVNVYNSFNIGKMHGGAQLKFTASKDTTDTCNYISTSGADMKVSKSGTVAAAYNNFTDDDYSNGKLAYTLNTNYTTGKGTRGYYTVQNNRTVFGNSDNQTTIVTIGGDTYYWNTNSVHDLLDLYPGHTFSIDTSTGGSLNGSILTVGLEMHILIN